MSNSTTNSTVSGTMLLVANLQAALKVVHFYGSIFIIIPGLILNTFTFCVFLRKRFWKRTTMGFYFSIHALFSALADAVGLLAFLPAAFSYDLAAINDWSCRIIWYLRTQVLQYSGYFDLFITIDRTVNVLYPRRFTFLTKLKNLTLISVILWVVLMLVNLFQWWRYIAVSATGSRSCAISTTLSAAQGFVSLIARVVPGVSSFVMNILMMRSLFKSKSQMRSREGREGALSKKEYSFAVSLISMNFILIVLTLPNSILNMVLIINLFVTFPSEFISLVNIIYSYSSWGNYL